MAITLLGLSFLGGGGFFGYRYYKTTKPSRAVFKAFKIESNTDLESNVGEYVLFKGNVQCLDPYLSHYSLDENGKPLAASIYKLEEKKWLEVLEDTIVSVNDPYLKYNFGNYFKRRQFVPKEQVQKRLNVERPFAVTSKKRGTVQPIKIEKASQEFPLLKTQEYYKPPDVLAIKGQLLTRIYETGTLSTERYLANNSRVTIYGNLKKEGDRYMIVPPDDYKLYIVTFNKPTEIHKHLRAKGASDLAFALGSVLVGISLLTFGTKR